MTSFAHELGTRNPAFCYPDTTLATAASLFIDHDCGILPVVDEHLEVIGVFTDRDMGLALAKFNVPASQMRVRDVMQAPAHTVSREHTGPQVLRLMRQFKVRRMPVVDSKQRLIAMISLNDLALAAQSPAIAPHPDVSYEDVMATLKTLCTHTSGVLKETSAVKLITV